MEPMLKFFAFEGETGHRRSVAEGYYWTAARLVEQLNGSAERTVALRKLLESRDCAMRADLSPAFLAGEI